MADASVFVCFVVEAECADRGGGEGDEGDGVSQQSQDNKEW